MKYRKLISMIMSTAVAFSLVSCGSKESLNNNVVANGEEIVIATSVAVTEILDALGVRVSGIPKTSYDLPESVQDAIEIGSPMSPDLEIIKSLNPSLVVSVDTLGADYIRLFTENNIPSEFVSLESLEGLKEAIATLGERFNKEQASTLLLNEIKGKEEEVKEKVQEKEEPEILVLFAAPGSTMIATEKSYIGSLVKIVGGKNIIDDNSTSFTTYNKEDLAMLNPDKILVMVHAMIDETKAALEKEMAIDSAWQNINAVKEGKVIYLDSSYFGMSANLKVIEGLDILSDIVHGQGE